MFLSIATLSEGIKCNKLMKKRLTYNNNKFKAFPCTHIHSHKKTQNEKVQSLATLTPAGQYG